VSADDLPRDPDWDDVPEELQLLAESGEPVTVVEPDGSESRAQLVIVPALFAHARRLREGD
jgi:hypothetical protein